MTRAFICSESAVSESLGYILIFGVVMACIALLYLNGTAIINNAQESTSFQGMEQSLGVVASDLSRSAYGESPAMTSRVNVNYGSLCLNPAVSPAAATGSRLIIYDPDSPTGLADGYDRSLGNITFVSSVWGKSIAIENGATLEMYDGSGDTGTIMTAEPRIFYSAKTRTLMVTVIRLNVAGLPASLMTVGSGVASIRSSYSNTQIQDIVVSDSTAEIRILTQYTGAWMRYIEDSIPGINPDPANKKELITFSTALGEGWVDARIDFTDPARDLEKITVVTYNIDVKMS
ncbi:MAG TPA: hypothetical protein VGJ92_13050 [Methanocella sp.]|jgi:hypothetical protein